MPETGADLRQVAREQRDWLLRHDHEIGENRADREINKLKFENLKTHVDEKMAELNKSIEELKSILKWAGGLIVSLMISFMAWALLQQYNANEQAKTDLKQQVEILRQNKEAVSSRGRLQATQERIEESLSPTGTAEATPRTDSDR